MRHIKAFGLAAVVMLVAAAGCATETGTTEETTLDAALLECGEAVGDPTTVQLSDLDLTTSTWAFPDGFVETFEYSEDNAIEHIDSIQVLQPAQDPVALNVLTIVIYTELDWAGAVDDCGRVPAAVLDDRLATYRSRIDAQALNDAVPTLVGGAPAIVQDLNLDHYSYRGYWVFSRNQLLHLYCQWTNSRQQPVILAGCEELVASVVIPGA